MKKFHVQHNVGGAKYLVNYHDGEKKHKDGSEFFDIAIFSNKTKLRKFTDDLKNNGFVQL